MNFFKGSTHGGGGHPRGVYWGTLVEDDQLFKSSYLNLIGCIDLIKLSVFVLIREEVAILYLHNLTAASPSCEKMVSG